MAFSEILKNILMGFHDKCLKVIHNRSRFGWQENNKIVGAFIHLGSSVFLLSGVKEYLKMDCLLP